MDLGETAITNAQPELVMALYLPPDHLTHGQVRISRTAVLNRWFATLSGCVSAIPYYQIFTL